VILAPLRPHEGEAALFADGLSSDQFGARRASLPAEDVEAKPIDPGSRASNDSLLYYSTRGGNNSGTWVEPTLAVDVAGWADPALEAEMKIVPTLAKPPNARTGALCTRGPAAMP
jgi:hypothetical protein